MALLRMLAFRPAEAGAQSLAPPPTAAAAGTARATAPASATAIAPRVDAVDFERDSQRGATRVAEPKSPAYAQATNAAATVVPAPVITASAHSWSGDANDWLGLIETAGLKGPVGMLAQHCTLIAVEQNVVRLEQNVVRLSLKPEHEHFSAPPLVAAMEEKIAQALGRAVKVRFEKNASAQQAETPAEAAGRARDARQQAAERALNDDPIVQANDDPIVQALMRDFDARLIPESVKPVI